MNSKSLLIIVIALAILGIGVVYRSRQVSNTPSSTPSLSATVSGSPVVSVTEAPTSVGNSKELSLTLISPLSGVTVTSASLTVTGKTLPNADVFVNDIQTKADASGNFTAYLTLDEGDNLIVISVNDADGNVAEKSITVTYSSGK